MKKINLIFVLAAMFVSLIAANANAQFNWVTANQGTFGWDEVTHDIDGDPPPPGTHVEYTSYYVNSLADPEKTNPVSIERTTLLQTTVTFPGKGRYWVGVVTNLVDDASGEILDTSDFAWSNVPEDCENGQTFGFQIMGVFSMPGGLKVPAPPTP